MIGSDQESNVKYSICDRHAVFLGIWWICGYRVQSSKNHDLKENKYMSKKRATAQLWPAETLKQDFLDNE